MMASQRHDVGAQQLTDGTTYLDLNNGIRISGSAGGLLTADASYLLAPGGLKLSGKTAPYLTANSTAVKASALAIGSLASYITANSTGIKIGTRYISTNTTGNTTT
jgi:hypothetical protein